MTPGCISLRCRRPLTCGNSFLSWQRFGSASGHRRQAARRWRSEARGSWRLCRRGRCCLTASPARAWWQGRRGAERPDQGVSSRRAGRAAPGQLDTRRPTAASDPGVKVCGCLSSVVECSHPQSHAFLLRDGAGFGMDLGPPPRPCSLGFRGVGWWAAEPDHPPSTCSVRVVRLGSRYSTTCGWMEGARGRGELTGDGAFEMVIGGEAGV